MSSSYHRNYALSLHKRDELIEFIKGMVKVPFTMQMPMSTMSQVFLQIEKLLEEHMREGDESKLKKLVPTMGKVWTPLCIYQAFLEIDAKKHITTRKFVPPSFNEIRHILNLAQVHMSARVLKLITFDGDQTLYEDGGNFAKDSRLVQLMITLLRQNVAVAVVTAAGYKTADRYEQRLSGLLEGLKEAKVADNCIANFYVLGGECNYLFQCTPGARLKAIPKSQYRGEARGMNTFDARQVATLLNTAESTLGKMIKNLGLPAAIIRKELAVGICKSPPTARISREAFDEVALTLQDAIHAEHIDIPYCAFNGGNDVFVDVGNKKIGVCLLQGHLGVSPEQTLHVGDQFTGIGNDIAAREGCPTIWIANPNETRGILRILIQDLGRRKQSIGEADPASHPDTEGHDAEEEYLETTTPRASAKRQPSDVDEGTVLAATAASGGRAKKKAKKGAVLDIYAQ